MTHSARARPAAPTPLQLGSGGLAPGNVYDVLSVLGSGVTSGRPVLPSTMPPKPKPTASDRWRVTCQVGSIGAREAQPVEAARPTAPARTGTTPAPTSRRRAAGRGGTSRRAGDRSARPAARRARRRRSRGPCGSRCATRRRGRPRSAGSVAARPRRRRPCPRHSAARPWPAAAGADRCLPASSARAARRRSRLQRRARSSPPPAARARRRRR